MRQAGTAGQVGQLAIQAGEDMLLMSPNLPGAFAAMLSGFRPIRRSAPR